jgi:hypothetical protein
MPQRARGPAYPLYKLKHSQKLVDLHHQVPLGSNEDIVQIDPVVARILKGRLPVKTHGIVHPTKFNVDVTLEKSDRVEKFPHGSPHVLKAKQHLSRHYAHMHGRCGICSFENLSFDPNTSSGYPFKDKKREIIQKYEQYLRWFYRDGCPDRPMPIYSVTPKVEYLDNNEIASGKIRLFTNPPLDYLMLEKKYYELQDDLMLQYDPQTWSALGFVKEKGGWNAFVNRLSWRELPTHVRKFFKLDVGKWDKAYGSGLEEVCDDERRKWFNFVPTAEQEEDLAFLRDEAIFSFEILPNGELYATSVKQKSGRLRTSTNNTLAHIFIWFYHYERMCEKLGIPPTYEHCMKTLTMSIYSDDVQGSTLDERFIDPLELAETYSHFGMEMKEFDASEDPTSIHFLGCSNMRWRNHWVPKYNDDRMYYALFYVAGRMSDRERTQRISGLAHNLAFSEQYADTIIYLQKKLSEEGRWVGAPPIDPGRLKVDYLPAGSLGN